MLCLFLGYCTKFRKIQVLAGKNILGNIFDVFVRNLEKFRAICSAIFIFLTNAAWIGGFKWAYGVPGHSISTLIIMSIFVRIYLKSKPHLATFILVYIFTSIPFYFLATAQNFIGLERSLKLQARTITEGNTAAIILSILLVLLATIATSFKRKSAKYICIGLSLTLWIAFLIHFIVITFYGVNYGAGPTGPAIYAIIQTNPGEAYEYILSQGKITVSLIIGIIFLLPLICYLMLMQHLRMELNDLEYKFVPFKRLYQRLSFNNLFISVLNFSKFRTKTSNILPKIFFPART